MKLRFILIPICIIFFSSCFYCLHKEDTPIIKVENNSTDTILAHCIKYRPELLELSMDSVLLYEYWGLSERIEPSQSEQMRYPRYVRSRHKAWKKLLDGRILLFICVKAQPPIMVMRLDLTEEQAKKMHWTVRYPEDSYLSIPLDTDE